MGLDIEIIARTNKERASTSLFLSRTFARIICDLEDRTEGKPILIQIADLLEIDLSIIKQMSPWEVDQRILYGSTEGLTKQEVNAYYEQAWQSVHKAETIFQKIQKALEEDTPFLRHLKYDNEWTSRYFLPIEEKMDRGVMNQHFRQDISSIVAFFKTLPTHSEVRFYFF